MATNDLRPTRVQDLNLRLRTASLSEVEWMVGLAGKEGWNPGADDAVAFRPADPDGFFVAMAPASAGQNVQSASAGAKAGASEDGQGCVVEDSASDAVAAISVVVHDETFAFLGFFITVEQLRGQGIGTALWTHALAHAGRRTVGLDGVATQEAWYARVGFVRTGATRRFSGPFSVDDDDATMAGQPGRWVTQDLTPADVEPLLALDAAACGYRRKRFLESWLSPEKSRRTVVLADLTGYATIRSCRSGCKIGPIVAPSDEAGLELIAAACRRIPAAELHVDVAPGADGFAEALKARGLVETYTTARMYRGEPPKQTAALLAIGSMELG